MFFLLMEQKTRCLFAHSLEVNTFFLKVYNENGKMIANTVLVLTPQGIVVHPLYNASNIYLEEVLFISLARLLLNGWIPRILFEETSGGLERGGTLCGKERNFSRQIKYA